MLLYGYDTAYTKTMLEPRPQRNDWRLHAIEWDGNIAFVAYHFIYDGEKVHVACSTCVCKIWKREEKNG